MTDTQPTPAPLPRPAIPMPASVARGLTLAGGLLTAASAFLAWTYSSTFPGDLTVNGFPGGLQWLTLTAGALTAVFALATYRPRGLGWIAPGNAEGPTFLLAVGALATTWFTLGAITAELGGLANLTSGGWIAGIASLIGVIGALGLPRASTVPSPRTTRKEVIQGLGTIAGLLLFGLLVHNVSPDFTTFLDRVAGAVVLAYVGRTINRYLGPRGDVKPGAPLPLYVELLIITGLLALGLGIFTFGIDTAYGELFVGFLVVFCFAIWAFSRSGLLDRISSITARHRAFAAIGMFVAAAAFPFTQSNDANATIGVNILIFGATALGLNVVVGLAGLLDLGYVAFLGVGAYAGALVSGAATSVLHVTFPFWAAALTGAAVAGFFGVLLGAPTLRVRGDYLAIVTLGFGEIFRIVVNNLDGISGPNVTNGPNGIVNIPDLSVFGFNLGASHTFGSFTLGRFANYFELMLLLTAFIALVFSRSSNSRIGRAWTAIREDEIAATAMGINGFRFKLLAFAFGATLAGLAGTVMAHVNFSVVPDPFVFAGPVPPNSAFLLAAVVIGGMGTVSGPLIGAALFYLLQAKLQFVQSQQLLLFGIALILFMRFRPEGIIASRRRQLEFHEAEEQPAATLSTAGA
ncbi:branched-chain amino acid transport system permease protein [Streptacidiphilus sp. MAP12-16]|uniref:branched-chain amino acid ABC transporter permease n=1 Tax=Streptacidiphilus sp. MAP12-16 TaxID=3156300 RepID=UPI0035132B9E